MNVMSQIYESRYKIMSPLSILKLWESWDIQKMKLELVFVKHYAPNCLTLTLLDSNTAYPWW